MEILNKNGRTLVTDEITGTEENIVFTVSLPTRNWALQDLQAAALRRAIELLTQVASRYPADRTADP